MFIATTSRVGNRRHLTQSPQIAPVDFVTPCCPGGFVFGIVALVYSAKVGTCLSIGDFDGARRASKSAMMWCWIAFAVGLLIDVLFGHFDYTVNGVKHEFRLLP